MNEIIYLETDSEITGVIDKLKNAKSDAVSLVIPRGAAIAQSIVNLKLLKKSAEGLGKEISLVANDRISRNLASQIGITVYSKISEAERKRAVPEVTKKENLDETSDENDFKINSYYKKKQAEDVEEEEEEAEAMEEGPVEEEQGDEESSRDISMSKSNEVEEDEKVDDEKEKIQEEIRAVKESARIAESAPEKIDASKKDIEKTISPAISDSKNPESPKRKKIAPWKLVTIIAVIALIIVGVLAYFFLPYATASLIVKTDDLKEEDTVNIDRSVTSINLDQKIIPGSLVFVEKEITKNYKTTGVRKEPGNKASGKITVYNSWDNNSITLEQGTKFTSGGKTYISTAAVTVPGLVTVQGKNTPGSKDVTVESEQGGEEYNIAPGMFTVSGLTPVAKQDYVYGRSTVSMTGGTSKTIKLVSEKDISTAVTDIQKTIADSSKSELSAKAEATELKIFDSKISSEIVSQSANKKAGEEAESFDYTMKLKVSVLGFSEKDLRTLMIDLAKSRLNSSKMLINSDKSEVSYSLDVDENSDLSSMKIKASFLGKEGEKISENELRNKIKNKKYGDAKKTLENEENIESVSFTIWPSIISRTPYFTNRIKIKFDYSSL